MSGEREKLTNMFSKIMAGAVTREEGTLLINFLAKEDLTSTVMELAYLVENPPPGVYAKTILHTIALARNKAFTNILVKGLEHKNEDVSILAAEELGRQRTSEAKKVLEEHLESDVYHVRKASAAALVKGFSDGMEIVTRCLEEHTEDFYLATYAQTLLGTGRKGLESLLRVMAQPSRGAAAACARALASAVNKLTEQDIPRVFEALMTAGDNNDVDAIVEILKIVAQLRGKASAYDGYVRAFLDSSAPTVRAEARSTLSALGA